MSTKTTTAQFVKFYDARTNGGFAQPPVLAPCEAADECHGTDSSPPTPPTVTSGVNLGNSGNVQQAKKKNKKAKKKKKGKANKKRRHQKQAAAQPEAEQWLTGRLARR